MDLQQAFDATAKILFGQEIGKLEDFAPYLSEMISPYQIQKSVVSGKEVIMSSRHYPKNSRFVSQDEISQLKFSPLNINEIKDVDSLFEAVSERVVYCGNKKFGRNSDVAQVDNCVDCNCVSHAHNVFNVKYGAYLSYLRESEHVFGVWGFPGSNFSIRVAEGVSSTRCFESYYCTNISETYYVFNCTGCTSCMFSFNLRSSRHKIGNLQLDKDRYNSLKKKLVSEMGGELAAKKKLFSLVDLAFFGRKESEIADETIAYDGAVPQKVEQGFQSTTSLILGKKRQSIKKYGEWLPRYGVGVRKIIGALGSPTYKIDWMPLVARIPADRLVTRGEGVKSSEKGIELADAESPSLKQMAEKASKVAYFSVEFVDGQNENCIDTPSIFTGSNTYKVWDVTNGKNSAYSGGVVWSEHIYGGGLRMLRSQFCICCNDSTSLKGCFEVDSSYSTRDSYLCHNVENIDNGILCFNSKALRYAVGNVEVGKDEFMRIKKMLLDYINKELDAKNSCSLSIFAIPAGKKPK